jgi:hypothetical protein
MVEDVDELDKLGQGFSSMDGLEKVDMCDGVVPQPTYVSVFAQKLDSLRGTW